MEQNNTSHPTDLSQMVIDLLVRPGPTFERLKDEKESAPNVLINFVFPLLLMGSTSAFLGGFIVDTANPWMNASIRAITTFTVNFVSLIIGGYLVYLLVPLLQGSDNMNNTFRMVFYATLPAYLAQILGNLHVSLSFFEIFGLYSFWLFWKAGPVMHEIPEKHQFGFTIGANFSILAVKIILAYGFIYLYNYLEIPIV